ncbi:junction-mediating and -regulatory protein [Hemiscyllium ocellatum]|uniref:junction-mediating and -regulatory protein n=1 Tax=Hemiscyllium ocellatum TaxID=170820 RepID=UPI00296655F8|nr:junction-mediating and -regulatory protein [Hemiscyllium ocellatum]
MSFAVEDNLESDWVAVRPNAFDEKEKHKFVFIVAWNEVEVKFAITCHNRTVQRKRIGARDQRIRREGEEDEEGVRKSQAPQAESPVRGDAGIKSPTRSGAAALWSPARGRTSIKSPTAKEIGVRSPLQGEPGLSAVPLGDTRATGCLPSEADILGPVQDTVHLHDSATAADRDQDQEKDIVIPDDCSWAGLFSFQDLRSIHQQLCAVNSELEPCLPVFPEEPSGMWSVLFGASEVIDGEMDSLCLQLQVYLGHALDVCGWKILSHLLFTENDNPDEYYESLSELRQKGYEEVLQRAKKRLQELLEKHKITEVMVELLELYQEEDDAYIALSEATTELYQYLLQPFRDMRELAMLRRQQIKISMENDYLGPRRIESLKKEDSDWQRKAHRAVLSIQDLTVKYFEITAKAQKAVYDRMRADQKKCGKAAWAVAVERMEKLRYAVAKETLQLMRAKEICLEQKKRTLKDEMQSLQSGTDAIARLDQLEADYYDMQLQLYEVQFEILKCEELLLTAQLESIKRLIAEKREEVVYYDTYESMEAMQATEDMTASVIPQKMELLKLQQKVRQLEARRSRISAKKAYLRNKKEICIESHKDKMKQHRQNEEEYRSHHAIKQMRNQQQEEEKNSKWVSQERQKTLDRLRNFKQRYPGQVVLKSTRLHFTNVRRKDTTGSVAYLGKDQTHTLPETLQVQQTTVEETSPVKKGTRSTGATEFKSILQEEECFSSQSGDDATPELLQPISLPSPLIEEISNVDIVPPPPPPPPPPLPPPPPPIPVCEESVNAQQQIEKPVQSGDCKETAQPISSPIPHLFDSKQLLNARKKLKKTASSDELKKQRVSSPMDEVLASLKRGSFHLRKVDLRSLPPFPNQDDSNNILAQIRKGVKLKKVRKEALRESSIDLHDADPLTRSIHEALRRIKEASPESEDDEDEGLTYTDWEN